jgi:hypothetical protein
MSPPNANARLCLTGRARKTNLNDSARLTPAPPPVKSDLLDFMRKPSFATFLRCFPTLSSGEKPGTSQRGASIILSRRTGREPIPVCTKRRWILPPRFLIFDAEFSPDDRHSPSEHNRRFQNEKRYEQETKTT